MKKVFIDIGAHCGCSIRCFNDIVPDAHEWIKYSFEPNFNLWDCFDSLDTNLVKQAALDYDGFTPFWIVSETKSGSSIYESKVKKIKKDYINVLSPITAECVNLSGWIQRHIDKDDFVFLKLDCECAEYKILKQMIDIDHSMSYVNVFSGEFHNQPCGISPDEDKYWIKRLEDFNLEFVEWNAMGYCLDEYKEPWHLQGEYSQVFNKMRQFWTK